MRTFDQWIQHRAQTDPSAKELVDFASSQGIALPSDVQSADLFRGAIRDKADAARRDTLLGAFNRFFDAWGAELSYLVFERRKGIWQSGFEFISNNMGAFCTILIVMVLLGTLFYTFLSYEGRFLELLARTEVARGVITYLFAIGTIGVALLICFAIFTGSFAEANERFQRGKDVLMVLIGVFGTIIGFYFGSEDQRRAQGNEQQLTMTGPAVLPAQEVTAGQGFSILSSVAGGTAPYKYSILFDDGDGFDAKALTVLDATSENGLISSYFMPSVTKDARLSYRIYVVDKDGASTTLMGNAIAIKGAETQPVTSATTN
jgi:hypothetical protein